ncbi:MAG: hypothetical protein WA688_00685 [Thermoplasmata archaeon]
MSIKQKGRSLEKKVIGGSETMGRDLKKGLIRAGKVLKHGAQTTGRDVRKAGTKARVRMMRGRRAKSGAA